MKNIHKIIESPTEITDKCSWWLDTNTNILYRWDDVTEAWVTITSPAEAIEETDPQFLAWKEAPIRKDNILAALDEEVPNPTTKYLNGNRKWVEAVGLKGDIGPQGPPGAKVSVISTTTLEPGNPASVVNQSLEEGVAELIFSIPKGEKGDPGATTGVIGETGPAGTIQIASTETLPAGSDAYIETTGSPSASVLKFFIPEGAQGPRGLKGEKGDPGSGGGEQSTQTYIPITYNNLVDIRSRGELLPGMFYKIIDYIPSCTSKIAVCESAGHGFDILVQATSTYTVSEQAKAVKRPNESYFLGSNLDAWNIMYTLDENKVNHEWAGAGLLQETGVGSNLIEAIPVWNSMAHGGNSVIAVGGGGKIAYSDNKGMNWVSTPVNPTYDLRQVLFAQNKFIVLVYGTAICLVSEDLGLSWQERPMPKYGRWLRMAYGYGTFIAIGGGRGAGDPLDMIYAATSQNGLDWVISNIPIPTEGWKVIQFGGGKFVVTTSSSSATPEAVFSVDGINWQSYYLPAYSHIFAMTYGAGRFVTVAWSGGFAYSGFSDDGETWERGDLPQIEYHSWRDIIYGNGVYIATNASTQYGYSTNGKNWTIKQLPQLQQAPGQYNLWKTITYGNGRFTLISDTSPYVLYSLDGVTWQQTLGAYNFETVLPGTGVVYSMTDEFGNTLPYDFKSIKFQRNFGSGNKFYYAYSTLRDSNIIDASLNSGKVTQNKVSAYQVGKQYRLPDNVLYDVNPINTQAIKNNRFSFNVVGNTFGANLKNCEIESNVKNQDFTAITGMYNKDYTIRVVNANTGNPIITALDASGVNVLITT